MSRPLRVAIFNDTRNTSHYGCEFVMDALLGHLARRGIEVALCWPMGEDWRRDAGLVERLRGIDGILVNGEGSIHDSARRPRAHYLTEVAGHFRATLGVPSFLVNASLYALEDNVLDKLRAFAGIWVREGRSLALLREHAIAAGMVPDLTLWTAPPAAAARSLGVLGTDSVRKPTAQRLKALSRRCGWDYTKLTHAARPLVAEHGFGAELVRRYAKWLWALLSGRNTRPRQRFLPWLAAHELVVTGRFHAVTLCLATRTPFLAVESNTPKISALLEDALGNTARVRALDTLEAAPPRPAEHAWSAAEQAALERFLARTRRDIDAMFDSIHACLRQQRESGASA